MDTVRNGYYKLSDAELCLWVQLYPIYFYGPSVDPTADYKRTPLIRSCPRTVKGINAWSHDLLS